MSHFKDDLLTPRDNERIAESWTDISFLLLSGLWYWHNLIDPFQPLHSQNLHWVFTAVRRASPATLARFRGQGRERRAVSGVTARQLGANSHIKCSYSIHVTRQIWNVLARESFSSYESVHLCSLTHTFKNFKKKETSARILYECKVEVSGNCILTLKASNT